MLDPLIGLLPELFQVDTGQRARLLRQPTIGSVIPDLLLGIWSGDLPRYKGMNTVSRCVLAWLFVKKLAVSEEQIREDLLISQNAADYALSTLSRIGAVAKRDSGEVELRSEFDASNSVRLIAIEMKLKRWKDALAQAVQYREFADESYVILDGNQAKLNEEARQAFIAHGVGLFLQRGGELKQELRATSVTPRPSVDRLFALDKLVNAGPYCLA